MVLLLFIFDRTLYEILDKIPWTAFDFRINLTNVFTNNTNSSKNGSTDKP